jgi:hypothetical protein
MMRTPVLLAAVLTVGLTACSGDDDTTTDDTTTDDTTTDDTAPATSAPEAGGREVATGEPFPAERCAANEAAGTIDYFTGFDYAAAASILEVIVAEQAGYYDELCLDVEITPSFSTANYPLVAGERGPVRVGRIVQRGRHARARTRPSWSRCRSRAHRRSTC